MSLLFDPLYPTVVQYVVSQPIWQLFEIHFWQLLSGTWGKNRVFLTLQHRYEKKNYQGHALAFLVFVFAITHLIQWFMVWRQQIPMIAAPEGAQNNAGVDNQNRPNDANAGNDSHVNPSNQQPNPENNNTTD